MRASVVAWKRLTQAIIKANVDGIKNDLATVHARRVAIKALRAELREGLAVEKSFKKKKK